MPFTPMTGLELPDDASTVWRYMDLWKFQSILETSALYFVRSDRFSDSWDSVLPPKWREKMQRVMCDRPNGGKYTEAAWYEEREIPANPILCWNCAENENERMWREYTSSTDALVISSTVGRFKECFSSTSAKVRIGLVNYGYHDNLDDPKFTIAFWGDTVQTILPNPWYVPRWFKKSEFAFENELRATIHVARENQPIDPGIHLVIGKGGIRTLVQTVYLHPHASGGFRDQVQLLLSSNGFGDILVQPSALA